MDVFISFGNINLKLVDVGPPTAHVEILLPEKLNCTDGKIGYRNIVGIFKYTVIF